MDSNELKALRKGMGLTQAGLANVLGISRKTINEMERGSTIGTRTEMAVRAHAKGVKVLQDTFWVEATNRDTYMVARRLIREVASSGAMFSARGESMLHGEFKRRDHAYRWCAALRVSDDTRATRDVQRRRLADLADAA